MTVIPKILLFLLSLSLIGLSPPIVAQEENRLQTHTDIVLPHAVPSLVPLEPLHKTNAVSIAEVLTLNEPIKRIWQQSNSVIRVTLMVLLLMSMVTWYITGVKWIEQRYWHHINRQVLQQSGDWIEKVMQLPKSPYYHWLVLAQTSVHQAKTKPRLDPDNWIANTLNHEIERVSSHLRKKMTILATIGSTAPFIGLFGTVWSIYHALSTMGVSGSTSIDQVAGPIGEALIMTAVGLAVAVPAVFCYNYLSYCHRRLIEQIQECINQLHAELVMLV